MDTQQIQSAITNSQVLSAEEKKILQILVPFMSEPDLNKLQAAFDQEKNLFAAADYANTELKKQAPVLFHEIFKSFKNYQQATFQHEEAVINKKDLDPIQNVVDNL